MTTSTPTDTVRLGYEAGSGAPVEIPVRHMAVTGQTQESGKTTTLEALVARAPSGTAALAFVTKRGERSFADARQIEPYFRDRADWQFVTSLIDATLQEKNKFLRPWIMKICRTTRTLADVQHEVRKALAKAKGINEGVYTQLDAYLDLIVPEIERIPMQSSLDLRPGLNVMDLSRFATPMQMLFVQSAIDWVNAHAENTIVVVPEAWEFIPEGKNSPVKASAVDLVRKGATLGNRIWVDSQDMAGVDKVILRGCTVWLIGVQREANEIKRNLANIPAGIRRPKPADIAHLERGQFYACWKDQTVKTYVQPATGQITFANAIVRAAKRRGAATTQEHAVNESEARALRAENEKLTRDNRDLLRRLEELEARARGVDSAPSSNRKALADAPASGHRDSGDADRTSAGAKLSGDLDEGLYQQVKARIVADLTKEPAMLRLLLVKPELEITVTREVIQAKGDTLRGRIAQLLADGFYDRGATAPGTHERRLSSTDRPRAELLDALAAFRQLVLEILERDEAPFWDDGLAVQSVTINEEGDGRLGCVVTSLKVLEISNAPAVINTPYLREDVDLVGGAGWMPPRMVDLIQELEAAAERYVQGERVQGDLFAGKKSESVPDADDLDDRTTVELSTSDGQSSGKITMREFSRRVETIAPGAVKRARGRRG